MSFIQRIESRFGLTRGDVTVALFLAGSALFGFIYTEFFEGNDDVQSRAELLALAGRYDSVREARSQAELGGLYPHDSDSVVRPWDPLTEEEVLRERMSEGGSTGGRAKKLTLEDAAPIDINTAPPEVLQLLPRVGETIAGRIVEYRAGRPFRKIEEIMKVRGIGPKTFDKMKGYLTVGNVGAVSADSTNDGQESTGRANGDTGHRG